MNASVHRYIHTRVWSPESMLYVDWDAISHWHWNAEIYYTGWPACCHPSSGAIDMCGYRGLFTLVRASKCWSSCLHSRHSTHWATSSVQRVACTFDFTKGKINTIFLLSNDHTIKYKKGRSFLKVFLHLQYCSDHYSWDEEMSKRDRREHSVLRTCIYYSSRGPEFSS